MAKLQPTTTVGFNAGKKNGAKLVPINEIKIDSEIAGIFKISDKVLKEIQQRIEKFGFNEEEPVVLWKGKNILVDGRTRYTGSKNAGLTEIWAIEKEFENREAAILYTFERQVLRRNLTGAEILTAAQMIKGRKEHDGTGRAAANLADRLGCSESTVRYAITINKEGTPEDKEAVKKGEKSLKKTANEIKDRQRPEKELTATDAQGPQGNITFLKAAVVLLVQQSQVQAAEMLINHFLRKNENKAKFYKLLPEQLAVQLRNGHSLSR